MKEFLTLGGTGILILLLEIVRTRRLIAPLVVAGLLLTVFFSVQDMGIDEDLYGMARMDTFSLSFTVVISVVTLVWYFLFRNNYSDLSIRSDIYGMIVFTLIGCISMLSYTNLIMLFLGIEILSISMYVLAGSDKKNIRSIESSFKYFLMGAFASSFLLFGIAMIYGATGSFDIYKIAEVTSRNLDTMNPVFYAGIILIITGLGFKASAAPFHFWAPDVYEGAPTAITAFMATIVKTVAFAAFFRLFYIAFHDVSEYWSKLLWAMAILTIFISNVTAVVQSSFKRVLAYSGVAHAGFLLIAIVTMNEISAKSILFYAIAYSFATLSAFAVLYYINRRNPGNETTDIFNGLGKTNPVLAVLMTISLLSLAGIPPTAGFMAKYFILASAIKSGYLVLSFIAIAGSLIGVYYYFKVIIAMFFKEQQFSQESLVSGWEMGVLVLIGLATIGLGLMPGLVIG